MIALAVIAFSGGSWAQGNDDDTIPKIWSPNPAIGIIVDDVGGKIGENGRMTAPQDQTVNPAVPKDVVVAIGGILSCSVEDATDTDHWEETDGNDTVIAEGYEGDGAVSYQWSATDGKGAFTDAAKASTTWTAPAEPGTYTLSCKIDDPHADRQDPEVTGVGEDEEGTRNDGAITRSVTVTVLKVEMANPTGDPTKSTEAVEGQNEFTFNTASPGVLTIECRAALTPDNAITQAWAEENIVWDVSAIAGSTQSWTDNAGAAADNKGKEVNCRFTTLPSSNTAFGLKTVTMTVGGDDTKSNIEVFYNATAFNHSGGNASHPNWFHYYKQNHGGTLDYQAVGRSNSQVGIPGSIKIGNEAYAGDQCIITKVTNGQLEATGVSPTNRYYANFVGVVAHESEHANNQTVAGVPTDRDIDYIGNSYEIATSQTDPDDKFSARGFLTGATFIDAEVYAGGPVEQAGVARADTSQDWASPGTNSAH